MARILIIDDDDIIRRMLRLMLTKAGFDVLDAGDGKEGIELFRENDVDLVITDLIMPEKEGIEMISPFDNALIGKLLCQHDLQNGPVCFNHSFRTERTDILHGLLG